MSCNFPLKGFWTGGYTESGANELIISKQPNDLLSLQAVAKMGYTVHPGAPLVEIDGVTKDGTARNGTAGFSVYRKRWTARGDRVRGDLVPS